MSGASPLYRKIAIALLAFAAIALLLFLYIWFWGRFRSSTDDAYVGGNAVIVQAPVPGILLSIGADDTQCVREGELLFHLDPTYYRIALQSRCAALGLAVRAVVQKFEKVGELRALLAVKEAELVRAEEDYLHRGALVGSGGVAREEFEHAQAALAAAEARCRLVAHQLAAAEAEVRSTSIASHPQVMQAREQLARAWVDLRRCWVRAPVGGIVAQRRGQVGASVTPATPLLSILPLDQIWVDANFKETQLRSMRVGQPALVYSDLYGRGSVYRGRVVGIAAGTGSVFSLLPPQNATGNWIKIVQRLPVRIVLDPEAVKRSPLRLGLSMHVVVDTHDRTGPFLPHLNPERTLYTTSIFDEEELGARFIAETIIEENL